MKRTREREKKGSMTGPTNEEEDGEGQLKLLFLPSSSTSLVLYFMMDTCAVSGPETTASRRPP